MQVRAFERYIPLSYDIFLINKTFGGTAKIIISVIGDFSD